MGTGVGAIVSLMMMLVSLTVRLMVMGMRLMLGLTTSVVRALTR
jgi:hypothetical protein